MSDLGGYYNQFADSREETLSLQQKISQQKILEPSDIKDFFLTATQSLREREDRYSELSNRFNQISGNLEKATIGLERLRNTVSETVAVQSPRLDLQRVTETLAVIIKNNQNSGFILNKCRRSLDEVATVAELVANTIKSELADRHKKVASQKELALRLRDIDDLFNKCIDALNQQEKDQTEVLNTIQELLHVFGIKLPDNLEQLKFTDRLTKVISKEQEKLRNSKISKLSGLGQQEEPSSKLPFPTIKVTILVGLLVLWFCRKRLFKSLRV